MIKKRVFIFDLDGTLIDAYRAIQKSLNFTRKKLSYPAVGLQKVKRSVGEGDKLFIKKFFEQNDQLKAITLYRGHHRQSLRRFSKLKPKVKKLLGILKKRKKILAIASNRPKYYTQLIVQKLKIKKYFDFILCADEINSLKPNPKILNLILKYFKQDKGNAVYVGDMDIDLETAKRAGIDAVFVKNGSSTLAEVRKYKNKKTISQPVQLLALYN